MTKVSIIIPVHNSEKWLSECLDSCINQTLEDIEIICINDCSTDSCPQILAEYALKDDRIKLINNEKNIFQAISRNKGIELAAGEYIWFVDSDDYVELTACEVLYNKAKSTGVDILYFHRSLFFDENMIESDFFLSINSAEHPFKHTNRVYKISGNNNAIRPKFSVCPWGYITKSSFLKKFRFIDIRFREDTIFTSILFSSCDTMMSINYTGYFRRIRYGSDFFSPMTNIKLMCNIVVVDEIGKFIKENHIGKKHFIYKKWIGFIDVAYNEIKDNPTLFDMKSEEYRRLVKLRNATHPFVRKICRNIFPVGALKILSRLKK